MSGAIIGSTAYGTGTTSEAGAASSQLSADFDTFLLLLTSQLQNQDPLDPMESAEFTNQLVQYANVEQAIQTNSNLEEMIGLNVSNLATNAVSYVGKEVQVDTSVMPLQDGYAKFSYTITDDATTATAIITDSSGNIIHSFQVEPTMGKHIIDWDGKTSSGTQLEDGMYSVQVSAMNDQGDLLEPYITTYGIVTSIASDGIDIAVGMDDVVVTLDRLLSIHQPENYTPPTVDDGTGSTEEDTDTGEGETTPDEETTP